MCQEVAYRDVTVRQVRKVTGHRIFVVQFVIFCQHHDYHGSKLFGHGGQFKNVSSVHRRAGLKTTIAKGLVIYDSSPICQQNNAAKVRYGLKKGINLWQQRFNGLRLLTSKYY